MTVYDIRNIYSITGTLMWKLKKKMIEVNHYIVSFRLCSHLKIQESEQVSIVVWEFIMNYYKM